MLFRSRSLAGVAYAPSSRDPDVDHLYLADRGVDLENDGRIYEVTLAEEPGFLSVQIESAADDAEENASGSVERSSPTLEMVLDDDPQTVGLRFPGLALPQGASILEAHVQFSAAAASSLTSSLRIQGHAVGDAPPFRSGPGDLSARQRTLAFIDWSPPAWEIGGPWHVQRTPDLSSVLQEIVDQPSWSPGGADRRAHV